MSKASKTLRNLLIVHLHVHDRLTLSAIASRVGLTRQRVQQIVRTAGIGSKVTDKVLSESRGPNWEFGRCEFCGTMIRKQRGVRMPRFCSKAHAAQARGHSDDHLLTELRKLALTLDRTPVNLDFVSPWPSHTTYYLRFGSLMKAQQLVGLTPSSWGGPRVGHPSRSLPAGYREEWGHLLEEVVV